MQLVMQLAYSLCISYNRPLFYLGCEENLVKNRFKRLSIWLSAKFSFLLLFMSLLTSKFVKSCHILARTCFMFLKNVQKKTWNSFNTKFLAQRKNQKSSYQVIQNLDNFFKNSVKRLRTTKTDKGSKFELARGVVRKKRFPDTIAITLRDGALFYRCKDFRQFPKIS